MNVRRPRAVALAVPAERPWRASAALVALVAALVVAFARLALR